MGKRPYQTIRLHPNEYELIMLIRNRVRFGFVEVIAKDGLPMKLTRRVEDYSCTVDNGPFDGLEKDATITE